MWVDSWPTGGDTCPDSLDLNNGAAGVMMRRFLINRHKDKTNVGFVDGHVDPIKLENLWSLKWGRKFQTTSVMTRSPSGDPIYKKD
jgi:prepilin-type processing-associated H-X9-DG protein